MTEKKKSSTNYEKHIVKCHSCGKDVLDHMKECPHCGAELPVLYQEMSPKTKKTIKIALWILLGLGAVAIILLKVFDII